jgi:Phosphotransferase enzyme family
MNDSIEHRADALFALPEIPESATVFGDPPGWRADLGGRGIELTNGQRPDLAVAGPEHTRDALSSGAQAVIVDASRSAAGQLRHARLWVSSLLPMPVHGTPVLYLNLGQRAAARYGITSRGTTTGRLRLARDRLAAAAAASGALGYAIPTVTVGTRSEAVPALLQAARELGLPEGASWNMIVAPGSPIRRNAFLLFAPGSTEPDYALKFSRVPGVTIQFEREERGVEVARAAGSSIASVAPTYMGRVAVRGHNASLETAARGERLTSLLRGPADPAAKLRAVERVVDWLEQVARNSASPPETLAAERARITREVLPEYADRATRDLADQLPAVPAVFCHNDPSEENIVIARDGLTLLDWEWAQRHGLPLADLVYFAGGALRILDGAGEDDRVGHFVRLMQGGAPSSRRMFGWIARVSRVLELPAAALGPLVTLSVLEHGHASRRERHRFEEAGGAPLAPALAERIADAWLTEPGLGPTWDAFAKVRG